MFCDLVQNSYVKLLKEYKHCAVLPLGTCNVSTTYNRWQPFPS